MPSLTGWHGAVNKLYPRRVDPVGQKIQVSVNGGERTLTMEAGRPLLFGLMSAGTYIPSACGGRGSCGQCRVRIAEGAPPHNQAEALLISEADQRLGVHLSCQILPDGPLSIEIQQKHFAARQHAASVVRVRELTWEIREITLDVTGAGGFSFVAGQYVQVFLPGKRILSRAAVSRLLHGLSSVLFGDHHAVGQARARGGLPVPVRPAFTQVIRWPSAGRSAIFACTRAIGRPCSSREAPAWPPS